MNKTISKDPLIIEFIEWCNSNGLVASREKVLSEFMKQHKPKYTC